MTLTRIPLYVSLCLTLLIMSDSSSSSSTSSTITKRIWNWEMILRRLYVCCVPMDAFNGILPLAFACIRVCACACAWNRHTHTYTHDAIRIYLGCIFPLRQPFVRITYISWSCLCQIGTSTLNVQYDSHFDIWIRNTDRVTDFSKNRCAMKTLK